MRVIIRTKNLELTAGLSAFIEEKMQGLEKFVEFSELFFEVEKETKHHKKGEVFKAEAMIMLPGKKIIAVSRGQDITNVVVDLKDELQQEIKKYKFKNKESVRRQQRKTKKTLLSDEEQR